MIVQKCFLVISAFCMIVAVAYLVNNYQKGVVTFLVLSGTFLVVAGAVGIHKVRPPSQLTSQAQTVQKLLHGDAVTFEQFIDISTMHNIALHELNMPSEKVRQFFYPSNIIIRLGVVPTNLSLNK